MSNVLILKNDRAGDLFTSIKFRNVGNVMAKGKDLNQNNNISKFYIPQ